MCIFFAAAGSPSWNFFAVLFPLDAGFLSFPSALDFVNVAGEAVCRFECPIALLEVCPRCRTGDSLVSSGG